MLNRILQWDRETFIYLNSLGIEAYDGFWSAATDITSWIPLFVLFFILLVLKYPVKEAVLMCLSVIALALFIVLVTDLTKEFFARLRPNNNADINTLIRILRSPSSYSFFSGHAASSFSITTLVVLFLRKKLAWVWLFYLWPLIFSFSRIYIGVHYPIDIMTGAAVGVVSAFMFYGGYHRVTGPYLRSGRP
jgi:undecaprenyl-diphosphatase